MLYQLARGLADRNSAKAFANGLTRRRIETRVTCTVCTSSTFQQFVDQRHLLDDGGLLDVLELRVHRRRADRALGLPAPARALHGFRNAILLANVIGLLGYVFDADRAAAAARRRLRRPAPRRPRLLAANPYAAMPSLHAADALIVGVVLFSVCRNCWAKAVLGRSGPPGSGSP